MDDDKVLAGLIQDYPDALSDRKRLQALLLDLFPQDRRKRNLLLIVFDDGIVGEMQSLKQMDHMTRHRFVRSIEQGYDIRTKSAESAVMLWAKAMGLSVGGNDDQEDGTSTPFPKRSGRPVRARVCMNTKKLREDCVFSSMWILMSRWW